jgi:hypothetical protein
MSDTEATEFARGLAARRKRVATRCAVCGAELVDVTTRRRFCSNRCAVRAHRQRQRDQEAPRGEAPGRG